MINGLDVFIIATFITVIAVGFFSGVTRVTSAILAIYFSSIVSAAFYDSLTDAVRTHITSMGEETGHLFFFCVLFFFFTGIFTFMISKWLGALKFPRRLEIVDNVGGAALGVIVSSLAVTLAATLLVVILQALNQTFGSGSGDSMVGLVHNQINDSALVPLFMRISPHFVRLISPWFPSGLPPILSGAVEA
jgi:uncharacterized membrane protein required for colicin V production